MPEQRFLIIELANTQVLFKKEPSKNRTYPLSVTFFIDENEYISHTCLPTKELRDAVFNEAPEQAKKIVDSVLTIVRQKKEEEKYKNN